MLDHYCSSSDVLERLRAGPAGRYLDGFAAVLRAAHYTRKTGMAYLCTAAHLGVWCARCGIPFTGLDEELIGRFELHLPQCRCLGTQHRGYPRASSRVRRFVDHLRQMGVVTVPGPEPPRLCGLMQEYCAWMRRQRGLTPRTLADYTRLVGAFIEALGDDPGRYDAAGVRVFVLHRLRHHERHSAPAVTTALRGFLGFLVAQGRCSADLIAAVPSVPRWRLRPSLADPRHQGQERRPEGGRAGR